MNFKNGLVIQADAYSKNIEFFVEKIRFYSNKIKYFIIYLGVKAIIW